MSQVLGGVSEVISDQHEKSVLKSMELQEKFLKKNEN